MGKDRNTTARAIDQEVQVEAETVQVEAETERVEAETERVDKGGSQVGITAAEVEEVAAAVEVSMSERLGGAGSSTSGGGASETSSRTSPQPPHDAMPTAEAVPVPDRVDLASNLHQRFAITRRDGDPV